MFVILAHNVTVSLYIYIGSYIYIYIGLLILQNLFIEYFEKLLQNIVLIILLTKIVESSNNSIDN